MIQAIKRLYNKVMNNLFSNRFHREIWIYDRGVKWGRDIRLEKARELLCKTFSEQPSRVSEHREERKRRCTSMEYLAQIRNKEMNNIKECACGINELQCEYHCPGVDTVDKESSATITPEMHSLGTQGDSKWFKQVLKDAVNSMLIPSINKHLGKCK